VPYIKFGDRHALALDLPDGLNEGQVNFILSDIINQWVGPQPNYARINAAIGILECAKLEVYRRIASPYEDAKITENGDVFTERG
jgi:hypothetical protein